MNSVFILLVVITTFVVPIIYLTKFWLKRHTVIKDFELDNSWDYRKYDEKGLLVPVKGADGQLIYVSNSTSGRFSIVRLDHQNASKESCDAKLQLPNHLIIDRKVFGLGNGKIVTMVQYKRAGRTKRNANMEANVDWAGSVIDPIACTSEVFDVPHSNCQLVHVLPYQDQFDVLLKLRNRPELRVLRYRDNGEIQRRGGVSFPPEDSQRLRAIKPFDPSEGYYYISGMHQESGLFLKKVSPYYEMSEIHGVHLTGLEPISPVAYSLSNGEIPICSFETRNDTNMRCLIADADFREIRLDFVMNFPHKLDDPIVESLGDGGALLVFRWAFDDGSSGVFFLHLRNNGLAHQPVEIVRFFRPVTGIYVMGMDGGRYCVTVAGESSLMTRCILPGS